MDEFGQSVYFLVDSKFLSCWESFGEIKFRYLSQAADCLTFCNHVSRIFLSSTPEILALYMFYLLLNFFILKLHIFPSLFRPLPK